MQEPRCGRWPAAAALRRPRWRRDRRGSGTACARRARWRGWVPRQQPALPATATAHPAAQPAVRAARCRPHARLRARAGMSATRVAPPAVPRWARLHGRGSWREGPTATPCALPGHAARTPAIAPEQRARASAAAATHLIVGLQRRTGGHERRHGSPGEHPWAQRTARHGAHGHHDGARGAHRRGRPGCEGAGMASQEESRRRTTHRARHE